jgi:hypothetical protein
MVETSQVSRQRKIQAWYICALLHYQGKVDNHDTWAVGLLRRTADVGGLKDKWEFVEGLDYDSAKDFIDNVKPRLVRASPGDLKHITQVEHDG